MTLLLLTGCASSVTRYQPTILAKGELTVEYDGNFAMYAEGKPVARGIHWRGLRDFVGCVEHAHQLARQAEEHGDRALGFAIAGGILGGLSLGGFAGFAFTDPVARWSIIGAGLGTAVLGVIFAGVSHRFKNTANGSAIDAMNFYNDAVGMWGGNCMEPIAPPEPASLPASMEVSRR